MNESRADQRVFSGVLRRSLKINECPAARRLLSAGGSRCHALQRVFIIMAAVQGMMAWLPLLTDGTLRHPSGCLLTRHAHYSRGTVIPGFRSHLPPDRPSSRPFPSLLPPRPSPQRWLCECCHTDYSGVEWIRVCVCVFLTVLPGELDVESRLAPRGDRCEFLFLGSVGRLWAAWTLGLSFNLTLLTPSLCLACIKVLLAELIKVRRHI